LGKKKKKEREMRERNGGRSPLGGRLVGGGDIYDEQLFLPVVEKMSRGRPIFFLRPDVRYLKRYELLFDCTTVL
jgi:hypothetical protein